MIEKIIERLETQGIKAVVYNTEKNGVEMKGIQLGEEKVRPVVYINENETIAEAVERMVSAYNYKPDDELIEIAEKVNDFEKVRENIVPCLAKAESDELVKKEILDMTLYYRIFFNEFTSIKINKEMLDLWNVSEEELYKIALKNLVKVTKIVEMREMLKMLAEQSDDAFIPQVETVFPEDIAEMIVLSTDNNLYGASAMLNIGILNILSERFNSDLVIIPSSIHECIVISANTVPDADVVEMIKAVNAECLSECEVLSNHPYLFRRESESVEKCMNS